MKNLINNMTARIHTAAAAVSAKLREKRGDFVMNHGVVFIIIIVVAALCITLLVAYLQGDFSSLLKGKVSDLFN